MKVTINNSVCTELKLGGTKKFVSFHLRLTFLEEVDHRLICMDKKISTDVVVGDGADEDTFYLPFKILSPVANFITDIGLYTFFIIPICGIILCTTLSTIIFLQTICLVLLCKIQ